MSLNPAKRRRFLNVNRPCGICKRHVDKCMETGVFCVSCSTWSHLQCEHLPLESHEILKDFTAYQCTKCMLAENVSGTNFNAVIQRLTKAKMVNYQCLKLQVRREEMILGQFKKPYSSIMDMTIDSYTETLMNKCDIQSLGIPLRVSADGSCLFNSVSILMCGSEQLSLELRVRTCIQLVKGRSRYTSNQNAQNILLASPSIEKAVFDCASFSGYSCAWTIMALCDVVRIPIRVVYPPMNGHDFYYKVQNTMLYPHMTTEEAEEPLNEMIIMWTRSRPMEGGDDNSWEPNHFVPILPSNAIMTPICSSSPYKFSPNKQSDNVEISVEEPVIEISSEADIGAVDKGSTFIVEQGRSRPMSTEDMPVVFADHSYSIPTPTTNMGTYDHTYSLQENASLPDTRFYDMISSDEGDCDLDGNDNQPCEETEANGSDNQSCEEMFDADDKRHGGYRLEEGKRMSPEDVFNIITSDELDVNTFVPHGLKENVYFIVDNNRNRERRLENRKSEYFDDCGVWESASGKTAETKFIYANGTLKFVSLKNNEYCIAKVEKKIKRWIPLSIQPSEESVVTMYRYYAHLKRDKSYTKRVTWFSQLPADFKRHEQKAIIEYQGKYPETTSVHGKSTSNEEYIRTNPVTMEAIAKDVKVKPNKKIYADLARNSFTAPRDNKQIRNKKYYENKKKNPSNKLNLADEVLSMFSKINEHELLQGSIQLKNKVPGYFLYTDDQLKEFINHLKSGNGPVGIDRTFNLSSCFVTAIVFKNMRVIHKETKDHPIMLGPMFLHFDATFQTYHAFLSHVKAAIGSLTISSAEILLPNPNPEIIIGSDDEQALTKALDSVFPSATRILCTKHLKDNVAMYLANKIGLSVSIRTTIVKDLFDNDSGLIHSRNTEFEEKSNEFCLKYADHPRFIQYYERRLKTCLIRNIDAAATVCAESTVWTNNNCESINNVLKGATEWKILKPCALLDTLWNDVVNVYLIDMRRCLHGEGNYRLVEGERQYLLPHIRWNSMTDKEKDQHFKDFIERKKPRKHDHIYATGTDFSIPVVPSIAKKIGQRTRPRSERAKPRR